MPLTNTLLNERGGKKVSFEDYIKKFKSYKVLPNAAWLRGHEVQGD